jgi:hypothetical protein
LPIQIQSSETENSKIHSGSSISAGYGVMLVIMGIIVDDSLTNFGFKSHYPPHIKKNP